MNDTRSSADFGDTEIIAFKVGDTVAGLAINQVREILKPPEITSVYSRYEYVVGVINLRGNIVTTIDLYKSLGIPGENCAGHIVLVEFQNEHLGLLVDKIEDSIAGQSENFLPVPDDVYGANGHFFNALYKRENDLISMLNLKAVLLGE